MHQTCGGGVQRRGGLPVDEPALWLWFLSSQPLQIDLALGIDRVVMSQILAVNQHTGCLMG